MSTGGNSKLHQTTIEMRSEKQMQASAPFCTSSAGSVPVEQSNKGTATKKIEKQQRDCNELQRLQRRLKHNKATAMKRTKQLKPRCNEQTKQFDGRNNET